MSFTMLLSISAAFLLVGGVCFLIAGIGRKSRQYLLASLGCFAALVAGFWLLVEFITRM